MRKFGGVILSLGLILTMGTAALADGFQMDRVTVGAKRVEGEDQQNWIYFNSNAKYDWMRMNLQGKIYLPQLDESYVDYSRDGMDDLYSGLRANFRFPELSKGLDANLGYKQNKNYEVFLYGVGYNWGLGRNLSMGLHYDAASKELKSSDTSGKKRSGPDPNGIADDDTPGDLKRRQEEFTLLYSPKNWSYALTAQNIDCDCKITEDSQKVVLDQKVDWKATSKVDLGLRYVTKTTEYNAGTKDDDSKRITMSGAYKYSQYWTWNSDYTQTEYTGHDGEADTNGWSIKAKYTPKRNWWLAGKLYMKDYDYEPQYTKEHIDANDLDADYYSRKQQVVSLEYEQKLDAFNYNLEVFVKNFDYENERAIKNKDYKNGADVGIIGTIAWDMLDWHWVFRAAPNGDLETRKGNYELTATYKF